MLDVVLPSDGMADDKSGRFGGRVSPEDLAAWEAAAEIDGRSLSAWIVRRCNGEPSTAPVRGAATKPSTARRKAR